MHGVSTGFAGPFLGELFGDDLPEDLHNEIVAELPVQSIFVLAQVTTRFAKALCLPAEVAALFVIMKEAITAKQVIEAFARIPPVPLSVRAAITRVMYERITENVTLRRDVTATRFNPDEIGKTSHWQAYPDCVQRDAKFRDVQIAQVYSRSMCCRYNSRSDEVYLEESMHHLPKWCWPELILATEKAARLTESRLGPAYDAASNAIQKRYSNERDVSLLIDHLDELGPTIPNAFLGKLGLAWMKRENVKNIADILVAKVPDGTKGRTTLESGLADAISDALVYGSISLADIVPRWSSNITSLYQKLQTRLVLAAYLDKTPDAVPQIGLLLTHGVGHVPYLRPVWAAQRFEWVLGAKLEKMNCLSNVAHIALPFWDLYWRSPATAKDVTSMHRAIIALPWQLQPTLMLRLASRSSIVLGIKGDHLSLYPWVSKIVDLCLKNNMFTLAVRALLLPETIAPTNDSEKASQLKALEYAMQLTQAKMPASHWGEVIDALLSRISRRSTRVQGGWIECDRYIQAFFSASDAVWFRPSKCCDFVQYVVAMWHKLPDRSTNKMNRIDAFCAQFTLDKDSEETFKKALHQSLRDAVDRGEMTEKEFAEHYAMRRETADAEIDDEWALLGEVMTGKVVDGYDTSVERDQTETQDSTCTVS